MTLHLLGISTLRPHEHVDDQAVRTLAKSIVDEGIVRQPLLVAEDSLVILDGHHRLSALRCHLRTRYAPCILVDYSDQSLISLTSWRSAVPIDRQMVLNAAETQQLLPIKTSRHIICFNAENCDVPLSMLGFQPASSAGSSINTDTKPAPLDFGGAAG